MVSGIGEFSGLSVPSAEPKAERTEKWHPTRTEIEHMAQLAMLEGMSPVSIAARMGKTVEQVRYQLGKDETQQVIERFREDSLEKAGFAQAQLLLALPDTMNRFIAITRDSSHEKNYDALKYHIELTLGRQLKQPEQQVNVTLNVTQQAATLVSEQLPKLAAERGEQRVEHPSNNTHLHFGEEVAESNKASLS